MLNSIFQNLLVISYQKIQIQILFENFTEIFSDFLKYFHVVFCRISQNFLKFQIQIVQKSLKNFLKFFF